MSRAKSPSVPPIGRGVRHRRTRCPACGRRPRRRTPRLQACDYCDSTWRWRADGAAAWMPSPAVRWVAEARRAPRGPCPGVTLGILSSEHALTDALAMAAARPAFAVQAVVLLDARAAPDLALPPDTRLEARPLAGHFGAQRTALQALSRTPWVLQLDTDERLGVEAASSLPAYLRAAERDGVLALGLPRRNLVDGVLSDHYPDPQYRLCRRTVGYEGAVHERPRLLSRARQSRLAIGLHVDHALSAERVRARTARYGAMSDGATDTARRRDEAALLTPFRP